MTEPEEREFAIAKMLKDSEPHETDVTIEQYADIVRRGGFKDFARAYDAGYRKADEVKIETAKDLITKIKDDIYIHYINSNVHQIDAYEEIRMLGKLLKEFGAEVEE